MDNTTRIQVPQKDKESIGKRIFFVSLDLILIIVTFIIDVVVYLKYLCSGPSGGWIFNPQYFLIVLVIFFFLSFLRFSTNTDLRKLLTYARCVYLLIWLIILVQAVIIPALPSGSC